MFPERERARVVNFRNYERRARERDARPLDSGLDATEASLFYFVASLVDAEGQDQLANLSVDSGLGQDPGGVPEARARVAVNLETRYTIFGETQDVRVPYD